MESFNKKMLEIAGGASNTKLQLSFYDLQSFLVHSAATPEVISKIKMQTIMELYAKASLEVCEQINKALEDCEEVKTNE